jgi:serine/threonine protein kinase
MAEMIGSTYEIEKEIGSGGGGVVYLATHLRLGKKVVLKADKRKISTRPEVLRREVDALKNLSHTYIPQVYDFFVEAETVYTVMDYIEGESLDKPLKRGERMQQTSVIKWACELLAALAYLHSPTHGDPPHGFVHSDIKPANLMLTPYGGICLIDFNIALALGEENIIGRSDGYASPEHHGLDFSSESGSLTAGIEKTSMTSVDTDIMPQPNTPISTSSSGKRIVVPDARSDIYSTGATLYHLLSGKKPATQAVDVLPLSAKEFSPQVVKIITKAMNPNPDLRFQSADEMLYAFEHLRENDPRLRRHKRIRTIAGLFLAVCLVAGAFTSFTGLKRMEAVQTALTLAEYSQNALASGDQAQAVAFALQALPSGNSIFVPPYTVQAKKALADSLGVYDLADGFKPFQVVKLPSETIKTALSPDGKTAAAVYAFAVAVMDTQSAEIVATLPTVRSALADIEFINDDLLAYAGEKGLSVYSIADRKTLWSGKPATEIAVAADSQTIVGVFKDEETAYLYSLDGREKGAVSFEGKKQQVAVNDVFANPNDNLFALNHNGAWLAVSFDGGALWVYDTSDPENNVEIYDESAYTHFEGGFNGQYLAFSSTGEGASVFAVIDMDTLAMTGTLELTHRVGVLADEDGVFIANDGNVVKIDPVTGEQKEIAYTNADVRTFARDQQSAVAAAINNDYVFFDANANRLTEYNSGFTSCDFVNVGGDYALVAGRDTPDIRILQRKTYDEAELFRYAADYTHDEARISADGKRVMLFDYRNMRLYDSGGALLKDTAIPDADYVYDQQYSKKSGNLAVLYQNALRIYSGVDGELLLEKTDLQSTFYAPYGVSILERNGTLSLMDLDTGQAVVTEQAQGDFAAYCGVVADSAFLSGGVLIGAAKIGDGYVFAAYKSGVCTVYDGTGKKRFDVPAVEQSEAFFTDAAVIVSPLHGTPSVYSLKTGEKITDLEKDAYLTYVTPADGYIISEYVTADGQRYGVLLDPATWLPLAKLTQYTDITAANELVFDYHTGNLRQTRIYSIDELIRLAKGGGYW